MSEEYTIYPLMNGSELPFLSSERLDTLRSREWAVSIPGLYMPMYFPEPILRSEIPEDHIRLCIEAMRATEQGIGTTHIDIDMEMEGDGDE